MTEAVLDAVDRYKILLVAPSGGGKTFSFRNVDPETFGFVNIENKPLPFKNKFKHHLRPNNRVDAYNGILAFAKNPDIKAIGIDSFSAYADLLKAEARANYKGWDIMNFYNDQISQFFNLVKKIKKEVVITSHYEILGMEGNQEKRVKVKGKE
jgi:hypothetical protein